MGTNLIIDERSELREIRKPEFPPAHPGIRMMAQLVSWIFHPVFIQVYTTLFMVYIHPYLFAGFTGWEKTRLVAMAGLMYTFFPLITVLLLKGLDFIDSVYLRTQKDRVIPIIATMIWYFWIWNVWRNFSKVKNAEEMPAEVIQFALAAFISTILALMLNIKLKISLHAIAAGVMLGFVLFLAFTQGINFAVYLSIALFITGLICTSRFLVSDHTQAEVYGGLAAGLLAMLIASSI